MVSQFEEGWLGADGGFYGSADEARNSFVERKNALAEMRPQAKKRKAGPTSEIPASPTSKIVSISESRSRDIVIVGDSNVNIIGRIRGKRSRAVLPAKFDVVISYAGADVALAEKLASVLEAAGVIVFFDRFYRAALWGRDLAELLDDIYRNRSRFCVMFVSAEYAERVWTTHEKRSALARDVESREVEYILPIKLDKTHLPGLRPTVSYLSLSDLTIEEIGEAILEKLANVGGT